MSENETRDVENEPVETWRSRVSDFLWSINYLGVFVLVGVLAAVFGVSYLIYANDRAWRSECHNAGGHVIEVEKTDICVDRELRVIFI